MLRHDHFSDYLIFYLKEKRMSSLRSSVRPTTSKQPWGTILQPEFGLGFQKMTEYEVEQSVSRLYYVPDRRGRVYERPQTRPLTRIGIQEMVSEAGWWPVTFKSITWCRTALSPVRLQRYINVEPDRWLYYVVIEVLKIDEWVESDSY